MLTTVLLDEVTTAVAVGEWQAARGITKRRDLYLDYLGAHLRHQSRDGRPRQILREIEYADTIQNHHAHRSHCSCGFIRPGLGPLLIVDFS